MPGAAQQNGTGQSHATRRYAPELFASLQKAHVIGFPISHHKSTERTLTRGTEVPETNAPAGGIYDLAEQFAFDQILV